MGIGGQASGDDLLEFIDETGTGGFTHLEDEAGDLWRKFGTGGRSTFMFIDDDGSYELSTYGSIDKDELLAEVQRLAAT